MMVIRTHAYALALAWHAVNARRESSIDGLRLQRRLKAAIEERIGPPELVQSPYVRVFLAAASIRSMQAAVRAHPGAADHLGKAAEILEADPKISTAAFVGDKSDVEVRIGADDLKALKERVEELVKSGATGESRQRGQPPPGVSGDDGPALLDLWDALGAPEAEPEAERPAKAAEKPLEPPGSPSGQPKGKPRRE